MTDQNLPNVIHSSIIEIAGKKLEVSVLEDGRRVITEESLEDFFRFLVKESCGFSDI